MKIKQMLTVILPAVWILVFSLFCVFGEKESFSESERRSLAPAPTLSWENVTSGEFASDFEAWSVDHFPARDPFRSLKAYTRLYVLAQQDNNGLYRKNGQLAKVEYPMNEKMLSYAAELFQKINDRHLKDAQVYFALVPDKNCYLGSLTMDYQAFAQTMAEKMPYATYLDIAPLLEAGDYYSTDTHWRQEAIVDVAQALAQGMGTNVTGEYETVSLDLPFYGVYTGQAALSVKPDRLSYLTNDTIRGFQVNGAKAVYDMEKAEGKDPYEMFLSGNQPLVTVKNPACPDGKRLILFRDSFGSSIAPLLAEGYSEVVLVDIRYVASDFLGNFVNFENADVLFLYSTLLLNSSMGMR